jgi:hypothetical protein
MQFFFIYKTLSKFDTRRVVYSLSRRARDFHLRRTLLLRHAFEVDEPYCFKFVECHGYCLPYDCAAAFRSETSAHRHRANAPQFTVSWHISTSVYGICHLLLILIRFWHMSTINYDNPAAEKKYGAAQKLRRE